MKYNTLTIFATLLLIIPVADIAAQARRSTATTPKLEDLPKRPMDTIPTGDKETFIIIYSNNTWNYYRPGLDKKYQDDPVFRDHWDTTQIFSYRSIQLADLPSTVDLKLIAGLDQYAPPLIGKVFSKYGRRGRRNHNGVDIPLKTGEPIHATFDGKVRYAKYNTGGYGYLVIVRHENGLETWYAHLSRMNVQPNDHVKAGEVIGFGGSTGRSRGPHLHFEMRYCDQTFDPEHLIDFESGNLKYQTFALEKTYFNINSRASDQLEDHGEFENYAFADMDNGEELTSEEIINRLTSQRQPQARVTASASAAPPADSGNAVYHTIRSGDILGRLAIKYGVSIDQICRLNNISRNTTLQIGKRLRIR